MTSRHLPRAAIALSAGVIAVATLTPDRSIVNVAEPQLVLGGPFPLADVLRNVALFAPLGASLAWNRTTATRALLGAALLSALIELTQSVIPGRFPDALDCVSNTIGAALGFGLFRTAPTWWNPPPALARTLVLASGALVAAIAFGTGALLAPAPSDELYYGFLVPSLANLAPYDGTVLRASIDDIEIPSGPIVVSDRIRERLRGDYALRLQVRAGAPPGDLAAFLLVVDASQREILLLGLDGDDLVFHFLGVGRTLGLETSWVRLPGALRGIRAGDVLDLGVVWSGADLCFDIASSQDCGHGFGAADGWRLLVPDARWVGPYATSFDAAWLTACFLPLGFWTRWRVSSLAAWAIAILSLCLAPVLTGSARIPVSQIAGACAGGALGIACRTAARRFGARSEER